MDDDWENAEEIEIIEKDFLELKMLANLELRSDYLVFSCNYKGHVWAYTRPTRTPYDERNHVQGKSWLLNKIAEIFLEFESIGDAPIGGRFFVNRKGAFYKETRTAEKMPFVRFVWKRKYP